MSDQREHIEGLRNGAYHDFKILYDLYHDRLYGFVFALTQSHSSTKDIVQEAFIKLWVNRERIDPDLSFKSYLFSITKNVVIDEFRRKMANPVFEDYHAYAESLRGTDPTVLRKMDFDWFRVEVEAAKSKLTDRQREIFELNKEQGLSPREIAERNGTSIQTVYNILSAALKIIKKEIGHSWAFLFFLFFE